MTDRELMQQALENCRLLAAKHRKEEWAQHILRFCEEAGVRPTALRARLAQPEQEPVTYTGNGTAGREADVKPTGFFFQMPKPVGKVYGWHGTGKGQPMCNFDTTEASMPVGTMLYTAPPQREWQGLTDEEKSQVALSCGAMTADWLEFARAIEAKLKEKNAPDL